VRRSRRPRPALTQCGSCGALFAASVTRGCPACELALAERLEAERAEQDRELALRAALGSSYTTSWAD
jgi:hypothetical protein